MKILKSIQPSLTIFATALFITIFDNYTFFTKIKMTYADQILFQLSIFIVFLSLIYILLNFVAIHRMTKFMLIVLLLFSALHAYFTDSFGIVGDQSMIANIVKTDLGEASDLFNFKLLIYFVVLGLLPSVILYLVPMTRMRLGRESLIRLRNIAISFVVIIANLLVFGKSYASFFREHKPLRYYATPTFFIYSSFKYLADSIKETNKTLVEMGKDAKIPLSDRDRDLVILVVGETARSDRFSLNGYARETNPLLKREDVISFSDVYSCGTSTATSVPCIFSVFDRKDFDRERSAKTENLVDVLIHTGRVSVLWRDNNSDSKGVADRIPYEDYKTSKNNSICDDSECRDEGMLVGLQDYINQQTKDDIFIVLHQMGNHGPAYYKRYPQKFEVFKPVCKSSDLGECNSNEINNAYDNAILYTDYFLSSVIQLLKKNNDKFETTMIYVSDHGESLGENGVYLHGLPYSIAPVAQRKVPLIMWFGDRMKSEINLKALKAKKNVEYSHDNIFPTIMQLFEAESAVYDKKQSIIELNHESSF